MLFLGFALLAGGLAGSVVCLCLSFFSFLSLSFCYFPVGAEALGSGFTDLMLDRRLWFSSISSRIIRSRRFTLVLRILWPMGLLCSGMYFSFDGELGLRANQAISDLARSFSGFLRTLRMTTPTISLCEAGCFNILLCLYCTRFPCSDDFLSGCITCIRIFGWDWRFSMNSFAFYVLRGLSWEYLLRQTLRCPEHIDIQVNSRSKHY